MKGYKEFKIRFGTLGLIRLLFYPLTGLITTPFRLIQTLWNCKNLLLGKWSQYPHFNANAGFTSLFYWTRALNLWRYGRSGTSPYLGLGNYNLARCFHYSLASLFSFWKGGTAFLLICSFAWLFSFFFWSSNVNYLWIGTVQLTCLISTLFYMTTFKSQNYNMMGWVFFPMVIYGITTNNFLIAGAGAFLASFGSFTVVFICGLLMLAIAIKSLSIIPLLAILPAGIKLLTHFHPFLKSENSGKIIGNLIKAIGLSRKGAKYKRIKKGKTLGIPELYYLLLTVQYVLFYYWLKEEIPVLIIIGIGIYLVNSMVMRFADRESCYLMLMTLCISYAISADNHYILPSLWLVLSPLPLLIGFEYDKRILDVVPAYQPFSIQQHLLKMETFLSTVNENERVFMAFDNPKDVYEDIYSGYRQLVELPSYVATTKNVHFMPEWWGVFELNYENAPNIWGREVNEVVANLKYWKAQYVVVYQDNEKELDSKWESAGFKQVAHFDWTEFSADFEHHKRIDLNNLGWWLLSYNEIPQSTV